jgi:hypothetical protein
VIERLSGETTVALKISIFNAAKTRSGPINRKLSVRLRKPEKKYTAIKHPAISREKTLNLTSKRLLLFGIVPPFSKAILSNYAMLSRVETDITANEPARPEKGGLDRLRIILWIR